MFENVTLDQGPSLNALRAFEAMGRMGKATLAAEELNVTHSAVSRQVKALEESLGVRLFSGPKHRLELTEAGRLLLPALTSAFDQIAWAVRQLRSDAEDLNVAVDTTLSLKWLAPRMAAFGIVRPEVRLQILELALQASSHRGADAVLRTLPAGRLMEPGVTGFLQVHCGPVLSAPLAARYKADLLRAPRLASATSPHDWPVWAAFAGVELPLAPERPFADLHLALDAAAAGLGAAIAPWPLVADDVTAGRLVAPFGFHKMESAFALIAGPAAPRAALSAFRDWLIEEGARTPAP